MKYSMLLLLFGLTFCVTNTHSQRVDLTRTAGASGAEVVEAVLDILRKSCIFPDDNSFLRRVAYVDSADGEASNAYRTGYYGGIWQIDEKVFNLTQTAPTLAPFRKAIQDTLLINWSTLTWKDLQKPLYSGIAAELALVLRLGVASVPVTIEKQAALWANNVTDANVFFTLVNQLNVLRTSTNDVDVVFVLDSSSSLSAIDFENTKDFAVKVIEGFNIDGNKVKVAVVEYSTVPSLIFGLTNNMSKAGILSAVEHMAYMPGGTATSEALQFVRDKVFPNGGRNGSSKIVILVTDGRSNDKVSTVTAANTLKIQGVTIFAVGVGSLVDKRELAAVASTPGCIYMKTVSNFTELPSINYEIQQLSLHSTVNLPVGTYTFNCDSDINVKIKSLNGLARTIEVTSADGNVHIYGSGSPDYTPNSAIYTFNDTTGGASVVQFYVRDGSEVFLAFRNASTRGCSSKFQVKVLVGDHIRTGSQVTCIENRLISACTKADLVQSPFVITGTPGPLLPNICPAQSSLLLPHPLEKDRYIFCSNGEMLIVFCNAGDLFDIATTRCVYSPSAVTETTTQALTNPPITNPIVTSNQPVTSQPNPSVTSIPIVTSAPTASATIKPPTNATAPLVNPCTPEHILNGMMLWPYPANNRSFIHCDVFAFSGSIQTCPDHKYYYQKVQTCLFAEVVVDPSQGIFSGLNNPCVKDFVGDVQYHPYPGDPHRFIQCDAFGDAFVKNCTIPTEIWEQNILNCIPNGFRFDTIAPNLIGK